jgi:hypothetical protein
MEQWSDPEPGSGIRHPDPQHWASVAQQVIVREKKTRKIAFSAGGRPPVEFLVIKKIVVKKPMACRMRAGQYEKTESPVICTR